MSSGPHNRTNTSKATPAEQSLRLWTRPAAPTTRDAGYVDETRWLRTRDPSADLPALFEALAARLDVIQRQGCDPSGVGAT